MTQQQGGLSIERLCELGRVSPATYCLYLKRAEPGAVDVGKTGTGNPL